MILSGKEAHPRFAWISSRHPSVLKNFNSFWINQYQHRVDQHSLRVLPARPNVFHAGALMEVCRGHLLMLGKRKEEAW